MTVVKIKNKRHKKVRHGRKFKFENRKNFKNPQLDNKIKYLEKNKTDMDSIKKS